MNSRSDFIEDDFRRIVDQRNKLILEKFGEQAVSGVSNSELLKILDSVRGYWKDFLRPALTSFSCEAVGGSSESVDDVNVIIALASAGFGIHDDIIDKSAKKHFRRTIPGLFGADNALLAGDLLIVKAWTMFQNIIGKTSSQVTIQEIIETLGNAYTEICEAEIMEISCRQNIDIDLESYKKILWKSAADAEACARIGALFGCGSKQEVEVLAEFGRKMGFIQRLQDDVKDSLNIEGNLPQRLKNERMPLPVLYSAKSSAKKYATIKQIIESRSITSADIRTLLEGCFESEAFAYVLDIAEKQSSEAAQVLFNLRPSCARKMLTQLNTETLASIAEFCL